RVAPTDTAPDAPPGDVAPPPDDAAYLLEGHTHYSPPPLSAADVLGHFAGLRPLLRARPADPSARSREFRLFASPSGLLSVAGGKYTPHLHRAAGTAPPVARRRRLGRPRPTGRP